MLATLLAGPARAEHIAMLAGHVGTCARQMSVPPANRAAPSSGEARQRLH
jgi:hypothetical protein